MNSFFCIKITEQKVELSLSKTLLKIGRRLIGPEFLIKCLESFLWIVTTLSFSSHQELYLPLALIKISVLMEYLLFYACFDHFN